MCDSERVTADDAIRAIMRDSTISMRKASAAAGRGETFLASYVSSGRIPSVSLMATIADVTNHELLLRNRSSGYEIVIDPPDDSE